VNDLRRRTLWYVVALFAVMLLYSGAYSYGMGAWEGEPRSLLESFQIVVEMFTATGFGSDAREWSDPRTLLMIVFIDLTGVATIFLALPVLVFPLFEELFATSVPRAVDDDRADHVLIVAAHTARAEALVAELDAREVDADFVEADRDRAIELYEDDHDVIRADPESTAGLERAGVDRARALIVDVTDEVDASVVLAAREHSESLSLVSVVEDPDRARYHELAGADAVLTPRTLLGERLAAKVTTAFESGLDDGIDVAEELEVAEVPVPHGSPLAGRTIADSGIREDTGATILGAWFEGRFETPPSPSATLSPGTVLLVSGDGGQLAALREATTATVRRFGVGEGVILCGHGEVGRTIAGRVDDAGVAYTVVDREDGPGVDVVGDATDPETLTAAGIDDARSVIVALPDDTAAEFVTLVARDAAPETSVVARVEAPGSVPKAYRAGADYALSLATVSGRMAAATVLDEGIISRDRQIAVVRTTAPGLAGRTLAAADVRGTTGCTVLAVERDGEVFTDVGPEFRVEGGDELVVAGTDEGVGRFEERLG